MSLIDRNSWDRLLDRVELTPAATAEADADRASSEPADPAPPAHLLAYNDPGTPVERYGLGWTLVTQHTPRWRVSMSLAARGAGAYAPVRVAQAVAVRVLGERGWIVGGWMDGDDHDREPDGEPGDLTVFRARLRRPPAAPAEPEPRTATRWRRRRHGRA